MQVKELDSDSNDKDGKGDSEKEKKNATRKRKVVAPASKPIPKKARTAKVEKEGTPKPIGRPGSPSVDVNKRESSSAPPVDSSSLNTSVSPSRPSPPFAENSRKRKMVETGTVSNLDVKQRKTSSSPDLITEQEVIDALRGHPMTTEDFLTIFRKRIKTNKQNRGIISKLIVKVAKHSNSSPRKLLLKPEFQ